MQRIRDWFRGDALYITEVDFEKGTFTTHPGRIRIKPMFAWYDIWIGLFVDVEKRRVYFFPVPMFGFRIEWDA